MSIAPSPRASECGAVDLSPLADIRISYSFVYLPLRCHSTSDSSTRSSGCSIVALQVIGVYRYLNHDLTSSARESWSRDTGVIALNSRGAVLTSSARESWSRDSILTEREANVLTSQALLERAGLEAPTSQQRPPISISQALLERASLETLKEGSARNFRAGCELCSRELVSRSFGRDHWSFKLQALLGRAGLEIVGSML